MVSCSNKTLLYCWTHKTFSVLVPKKRGNGFLRVPYGHHNDVNINAIGDAVGVDIIGLDGALDFECGDNVYYGDNNVRKSFEDIVIPMLERHYGFKACEVTESEYWANHPMME